MRHRAPGFIAALTIVAATIGPVASMHVLRIRGMDNVGADAVKSIST